MLRCVTWSTRPAWKVSSLGKAARRSDRSASCTAEWNTADLCWTADLLGGITAVQPAGRGAQQLGHLPLLLTVV